MGICMNPAVREYKFEKGAGAIGTRTTGGQAYLVSTTKTNELVEFFGRALGGPLAYRGKPIILKEGEHALIVRHREGMVNYYVYSKAPLLEKKKLMKEFGVPHDWAEY